MTQNNHTHDYHLLAEKKYHEIRFLSSFNISGEVRKYRNTTSCTYVFEDGSRLTILADGSAKVRGKSGLCWVHGIISANTLGD